MRKTKKIALAGVFCALAVTIMLMGGVIPLATFCSPMLAGLMLVPVFVECGEKMTYGAYIAVAALSLMLCPDKESALLMVFLGYYPALRWRIERIRGRALRIAVKLAIFNVAVGVMIALSAFVFRFDAMLREYREMGMILTAVCLLLGNICMLLFDRLLVIMTALYIRRFRNRLIR